MNLRRGRTRPPSDAGAAPPAPRNGRLQLARVIAGAAALAGLACLLVVVNVSEPAVAALAVTAAALLAAAASELG